MAIQQVPDWLTVDDLFTQKSKNKKPPPFPVKASQLSSEELALEQQTFSIAFESVLEQLAEGTPFETFCREYLDPMGRQLANGRFRAWILRNQKRREAYYGAKAVGAEVMEDEMIRIADGLDKDGNPSLNDVARSEQQLKYRKWLMQVNNRDRYGDIKKVESTVTTQFDPSKANLQEIRAKALEKLGITADDFIEGELDCDD